MSKIQDALFAALDDNRRRLSEWETRERKHEARRQSDDQARQKFLTSCRPARTVDYADWLAGWLDRGGQITHIYDYPLEAPTVRWWVLTRQPDLVPSLYGALSVQVVVPSDIGFGPRDVPDTFHGGCGHSAFYFMDGFRRVGGVIPLYPDVRVVLANR